MLHLLVATALAAGTVDYDDDGDCFCEEGPCTGSVATCVEIRTGDCDDTRASVYPAATETCQPPPTQLDNDCDGNPNTKGGQYLLTGASALVRGPFYLDNDGDGEGDRNSPEYWLCDRNADPFRDAFSLTRTDCNDDDPRIFEGAEERCNGIDDDCDVPAQIDEPRYGFAPAGSAVFHLDEDDDGFGAEQGATVSMCPDWYNESVNLDDCGGDGIAAQGHSVEFDGKCWNLQATDCDDNDVQESPTAPERLDGADGDCDHQLPLVELDCDGDGSYAATPGDPGTGEIDAATLGLVECRLLDPVLGIDCLGTILAVDCDRDSGLWTTPTAPLVAIGAMVGNRRVGQTSFQCAGRDCDDTCAARCEGQAERCDGIDGDCNGYAHATDTDGIPNPMLRSDVYPGWVADAEIDDDGDGVIETCGPLGAQAATASSRCEPLLVVPSAPVDTAEDEPDTDDDDGCGCTTAPSRGASLVPLLLLLPVLRRRGMYRRPG